MDSPMVHPARLSRLADTGVQGSLIVHVGCGDGKLTALMAEMDEVVASEIDYRKQKDFRWRYLDYLRAGPRRKPS